MQGDSSIFLEKKLLWKKPLSKIIIAPLAPAQPPLRGAHMMPWKYLY
jgi:hypothetical protein